MIKEFANKAKEKNDPNRKTQTLYGELEEFQKTDWY